MSGIATAIIGSAVVGGVVASRSASKGAEAARSGARSAAEAQVQSTQLQIEEMRRQFDYQMRVLQPQIQQQYNAQRAYSDLLGIGGPQLGQNLQTGFMPQPRTMEVQQQRRDEEIAIYEDYMNRPGVSEEDRAQYQAEIDRVRARPYDEERMAQEAAARGAQMGGPGTSGVGAMRDPRTGAFMDPNLDPTRLRDIEELSGTVQANLLAGTGPEQDPYRNYIAQNRMAAAGGPEESIMGRRVAEATMMGARGAENIAAGAAGTGVYGDVFTESPGYAFQREEMGRQLERVGSAGGPNIGGRAIMEAQRRAQGLAAGEYYNWAAGRERDLGRLGAAEAADIMRRDQFAGMDIERGDRAYALYEQQRLGDIGRQDQAYQDYLRRREGDVARIDAAAAGRDRLSAADQQRMDQAYYNYLNMLQAQAGFGGGPAAQAVGAAGAQGANVAGAYRAQGGALSDIYGAQGITEANVAMAQGAAWNNAIQGGMQNWLTYQQMQQPTTPPPTTPVT